ncbi:MAG: dihydrolipoamide acetyltransferase family protein [bacterium]|nr:dihydrolipoamide acetyltransferase family protein [bacterium]MDE0290448.1 dihydrolipoamide acetyltransferase family protein [bacterium]MDE0437790.1 dihydrolipoamide acetyltransferase family protein [bacterium]
MAREFRLPDVGEGLVEATIVSWYVELGATVGLDEPLVEVETDKAIVDIPSPFAGVLLHRGGEDGDTVEVESLLAVIGEPGERWEHASGAPAPTTEDRSAPVVGVLPEADPGVSRRPLALPYVRKLADELGVDLSAVRGTGPLGRITEDDVRAAASARPTVRIPMARLRRTIAESLSRSWREIPHVTTYGHADSDRLMAERRRLGKPPVEALLIARLVPLLVGFPGFNSAVEGGDIVERRFYDIGFAVDTPDGLMVAVVHDADTLSIEGLAAEVRRLASGARERTLQVDELRGQTFTVSNIGAVGGGRGTPIIPYGTSAILSVGRAGPRPVVRDGAIAAVRQFPLSLSYDHRIIDGAEGRRFLAAVIEALEG